jgi:hypothetical protein
MNLVCSPDGANTKSSYADATLFGDLQMHRKGELAAAIWTWTDADISRLSRFQNWRFLSLNYSFIYLLTYSAA